MKFSMECSVDSKTVIQSEFQIVYRGRTYIFYPDENGVLNKVKVIAEVEHPEKFYSEMTPNPSEGVKLKIDGKVDTDLYESVLKNFQDLESLIAFKYNLKSVRWDIAKYELIFDTAEEKEKAKLYSFRSWRQYKDNHIKADEPGFLDLVQNMDKFRLLIIPMSFYREGLNEQKSFRYINAFFNFYFVIEGLYGNKKTKNAAIENEFKKSADFRRFVETVLRMAQTEKPEYYNEIVEMLKRKSKTVCVDTVVELIVGTRGELHHFNNNPRAIGGTPFTHEEFEAIEYLLMGLALNAILQKIVDINEGKV